MHLLIFQHDILNFEAMGTVGFWNQFGLGLRAYASSIGFLKVHGLRHGYVVVLAGALITMKLVGWVLDHFSMQLENFVSQWIHQRFSRLESNILENVSDWLLETFDAGVEGFFFLLTFWIQLKLTKFLVLIVLGPIFAIYAELAARKLGFDRSHGKGLVLSIWRGVRSAVLLIFFEVVISISLVILFGVLPAAFFAAAPIMWSLLPVLSAVVSIWFYGAALMDLTWDLMGYGVQHSFRCSIARSGFVLAFGTPFYLAMAIPILGWLTGPILGGLLGSVGAVLCFLQPHKSMASSHGR